MQMAMPSIFDVFTFWLYIRGTLLVPGAIHSHFADSKYRMPAKAEVQASFLYYVFAKVDISCVVLLWSILSLAGMQLVTDIAPLALSKDKEYLSLH